jgi:hypothetical protein
MNYDHKIFNQPTHPVEALQQASSQNKEGVKEYSLDDLRNCWDAATEAANECVCGECDYCHHIKENYTRPTNFKEFVASLTDTVSHPDQKLVFRSPEYGWWEKDNTIEIFKNPNHQRDTVSHPTSEPLEEKDLCSQPSNSEQAQLCHSLVLSEPQQQELLKQGEFIISACEATNLSTVNTSSPVQMAVYHALHSARKIVSILNELEQGTGSSEAGTERSNDAQSEILASANKEPSTPSLER